MISLLDFWGVGEELYSRQQTLELTGRWLIYSDLSSFLLVPNTMLFYYNHHFVHYLGKIKIIQIRYK